MPVVVDVLSKLRIDSAIIGDILMFGALLVTLFAVKYARDSALAAKATVEPLTALVVRMDRSVQALQTLLTKFESAQEAANIGRRLDLMARKLEVYESIYREVATIDEEITLGVTPKGQLTSVSRGHLQAALATLPSEDLPNCRKLATEHRSAIWGGDIGDARIEIEAAIASIRKTIDELLLAEPFQPIASVAP
jgi:hypothetical protein